MLRLPKIYYGWYIVLASAIINGFVGGLSIYCFTSLINPIIAAFGWSLAMVSLASSLRSIESGALSPLMGYLADRLPARRLTIIGVIIVGIGFFLLSQVSSLWMLYLSFLVITLGNSMAVNTVPMTMVARWFRRDVGKATALLSVGVGLSGLLVPVVTILIDNLGWQPTLMLVGGMVWLVGIPLAFVFKDRPGDYGLLPDGGKQPPESAGSVAAEPEGKTLRQAVHTRVFWQVGIALLMKAAGVATLIIHIMPYLDSIGFTRQVAAMVTGALPLTSVPARFLLGWLADRYQVKNVTAMAIAFCGGGLLIFSQVTLETWGLLIAFVVVFSTGLAGMSPLPPTIIRRYFGTRRFGTIFGMQSIFLTVGSMVTPFLTGIVVDAQGNYGGVWQTMGLIVLAGSIIMLMAPRADAGK
jgi:MFS transporter, OFA family, oxalate/formate antiporter